MCRLSKPPAHRINTSTCCSFALTAIAMRSIRQRTISCLSRAVVSGAFHSAGMSWLNSSSERRSAAVNSTGFSR